MSKHNQNISKHTKNISKHINKHMRIHTNKNSKYSKSIEIEQDVAQFSSSFFVRLKV